MFSGPNQKDLFHPFSSFPVSFVFCLSFPFQLLKFQPSTQLRETTNEHSQIFTALSPSLLSSKNPKQGQSVNRQKSPINSKCFILAPLSRRTVGSAKSRREPFYSLKHNFNKPVILTFRKRRDIRVNLCGYNHLSQELVGSVGIFFKENIVTSPCVMAFKPTNRTFMTLWTLFFLTLQPM